MGDGFEVGMIFRHRVSGLRIKVEKIDGNTLWCSYPDNPPSRKGSSELRRYEKHPFKGRPFGALHKIDSLPVPLRVTQAELNAHVAQKDADSNQESGRDS